MASTFKYEERFKRYSNKVVQNVMKSAVDVKNDLRTSARSSAPHKRGILEKGINAEAVNNGKSIVITLEASAKGSNGYDYAEKMHNGSYNLGEQSRRKGSGYSGISGATFPVGKGYIETPASKNFKAYVNYIEKAIEAAKE